jgi:hypothetical protein
VPAASKKQPLGTTYLIIVYLKPIHSQKAGYISLRIHHFAALGHFIDGARCVLAVITIGTVYFTFWPVSVVEPGVTFKIFIYRMLYS